MAHLRDDVAAFVDGQLSPAATRAVESHLEGCESCRQAVRQQRLLKSRMRGAGHLEPPPSLVASLSTLSQSLPAQSRGAQTPARPPWWSRLLSTSTVGVGFVLLGASMAVVAVAYVVGPTEEAADDVTPPFDRYAGEFVDAGQSPSGSMTVSAMDELDDHGWPCAARLGGLERVAGGYRDQQETVALAYAGGGEALNLFEQRGALDARAVEEFDRRRLAEREVWVRDSRPRVVTWDADGVVYTVVTELGDDQLARALADLPGAADEPDPVARIGDGLNRMTTWISAS